MLFEGLLQNSPQNAGGNGWGHNWQNSGFGFGSTLGRGWGDRFGDNGRSGLGCYGGRGGQCGNFRHKTQPPHQPPSPNLEQLNASMAIARGQGDRIARNPIVWQLHLAIGPQLFQASQSIAQLSRQLKIQFLRCGNHLLLELLHQLARSSLKHHGHLLHRLAVIRWCNQTLTNTRAAANVVVQAGAISKQGLWPLPQGKQTLHQPQRFPQGPRIGVGAVVAIAGLAQLAFAGNEQPRIILRPSNAEIGIFLVILQQRVEVGLMLPNQVGLQGQGFRFRIGNDEFNLRHLPHHQLQARTVQLLPDRLVGLTLKRPEVRANPRSEAFGLAYIKDAIAIILHEINPRLPRQLGQAGHQTGAIVNEQPLINAHADPNFIKIIPPLYNAP